MAFLTDCLQHAFLFPAKMWCHEGKIYEGDELPSLDHRMMGRCTSNGTCYTSLTRSVGTVTAHLGCWFTDPSR